MKTIPNQCNKCHHEIHNGRCACGWWYEKDEVPSMVKTFERAIFAYDWCCEQTNDLSPLTTDHHTGNCMVLFKGDYEKVMKVKKFIESLETDVS